jgi:LacI family transcriptional regulator
MRATIDDVAAAAGVSRSTASRALSGHPAVLPATRERVFSVAEKLQYRADPVARALRAGNSGLIGLVLTNLSNPSIQEIAETVQQLSHNADLEVVMATTNGDPERERRIIGTLTSRRVDGLIMMGSQDSAPVLNSLYASGLAVVELVRLPDEIQTPSVVYDDQAAGRLAAEHLIERGHRRIAFLGGPPEARSGRERYAGFMEATRVSGLTVRPEDVFRGDFLSEFGAASMLRFLANDDRPTALVMANHEALFGALQILSQHGLDIPRQLSVVGIEDEPLLRFWHPSITVVDTLPVRLAEEVMSSMLAQLTAARNSETRPPVARVVTPVHLIDRASTLEL